MRSSGTKFLYQEEDHIGSFRDETRGKADLNKVSVYLLFFRARSRDTKCWETEGAA